MAIRFEKVEELTEEQKETVLGYVRNIVKNGGERPIIRDLVKLIDPKADGRSYLGKTIVAFLDSKGIKHDTTKFVPEGVYVLSAEEQDLILQRMSAGETGAIKISQQVFENPNLTALDRETRAVIAFINDIKTQMPAISGGLDDYNPPRSLKETIRRTNNALNDKRYIEENLSSREQKQLNSLRLNLHSQRLCQMWKSYLEKEHRDLFEACVIRMLHDKEDVTETELNMFLDIAFDQTELAKMGIQKAFLEKRLSYVAQANDRVIPKGLTEAYNAIVSELDKSRGRIEKNTRALTTTRADRLKNKNEKGVNFASLIEAFRDEKNREILNKNSEIQRTLLEKEIDRVEGLDAFKARILGIGREELLDG